MLKLFNFTEIKKKNDLFSMNAVPYLIIVIIVKRDLWSSAELGRDKSEKALPPPRPPPLPLLSLPFTRYFFFPNGELTSQKTAQP